MAHAMFPSLCKLQASSSSFCCVGLQMLPVLLPDLSFIPLDYGHRNIVPCHYLLTSCQVQHCGFHILKYRNTNLAFNINKIDSGLDQMQIAFLS